MRNSNWWMNLPDVARQYQFRILINSSSSDINFQFFSEIQFPFDSDEFEVKWNYFYVTIRCSIDMKIKSLFREETPSAVVSCCSIIMTRITNRQNMQLARWKFQFVWPTNLELSVFTVINFHLIHNRQHVNGIGDPIQKIDKTNSVLLITAIMLLSAMLNA